MVCLKTTEIDILRLCFELETKYLPLHSSCSISTLLSLNQTFLPFKIATSLVKTCSHTKFKMATSLLNPASILFLSLNPPPPPPHHTFTTTDALRLLRVALISAKVHVPTLHSALLGAAHWLFSAASSYFRAALSSANVYTIYSVLLWAASWFFDIALNHLELPWVKLKRGSLTTQCSSELETLITQYCFEVLNNFSQLLWVTKGCPELSSKGLTDHSQCL